LISAFLACLGRDAHHQKQTAFLNPTFSDRVRKAPLCSSFSLSLSLSLSPSEILYTSTSYRERKKKVVRERE
jgi:hypothetical protein